MKVWRMKRGTGVAGSGFPTVGWDMGCVRVHGELGYWYSG